MPEELDEVERKIRQLEIEREGIKREGDKKKLKFLGEEIANLSEQRDQLKAKWQGEKQVIDGTQQVKESIEQLKFEAQQAERDGDFGKVAEIRYGLLSKAEESLKKFEAQLEELQASGSQMLKEEVDAEDIAEIVAKWTGIPVSKMVQTETEKLLHLEDELHKRVVGQEEAIGAVSDAVRRSRAGLSDTEKPLGSFLFLGTTGVGKTELAKALAEFLFDNEGALTRIDMSEYQERHAVSRLVGAPPGYVGYEEGGQLTEAVRRKPYSVILLDEIEKAHPDAFNILLQVLDDGRLTDNKGRVANFKNTIIIMTSNLGSELIRDNFEKADLVDEELFERTKMDVLGFVKKSLKPEFVNRIDETIMFTPLTKDNIREIIRIQLKGLDKVLKNKNITLSASDEVINHLADLGYDPQYGARPVKRVIQKEVMNELSRSILSGQVKDGDDIILDEFDGKFVFRKPVKEVH